MSICTHSYKQRELAFSRLARIEQNGEYSCYIEKKKKFKFIECLLASRIHTLHSLT